MLMTETIPPQDRDESILNQIINCLELQATDKKDRAFALQGKLELSLQR
jgi:hypothetical protein